MKEKDFKVGDNIIITAKPKYWNSELSDKMGLDVVNYPYKTTIIGVGNGDTYVSMIDSEGYGWCLTTLVKENKIELQSEFIMLKDNWYRIIGAHSPYNTINVVKVSEDWDRGSLRCYKGFHNIQNCDKKCDGWIKSENPSFPDVLSFIKLSLEEVQEYLPDDHEDKIKKEIIMERKLAKAFAVLGSVPLTTAFYNELTKLGYEEGTYTPKNNSYGAAGVATNTPRVIPKTSLQYYKRLYYGSLAKGSEFCETFRLPQQWDEALAFAKEQLDDKYWVEPEEVVEKKPKVVRRKAVKKVEEYAVGTYMVAVKDCSYYEIKKGFIDIIEKNDDYIWLKNYRSLSKNDPEDEFKWFATYDEAKAYSDTLLAPKKQLWDVDTYAVCLVDGANYSGTERGDIYLIKENDTAHNLNKNITCLSFSLNDEERVYNRGYAKTFKPFLTLEEAEQFAKELLTLKPKFEVGKYYKWYQSNYGNYHYGKCSRADYEKNDIQMSPWICNLTSLFPLGGFDPKYSEQIEEISVEDIQQFLPDGHPDKIVIKPKKWDVGTFVVVFKEGNGVLVKQGVYKINKFRNKIISINGDTLGISREDRNQIKWVATYEEGLEVLKEYNKPKFKENQWLYFKDNYSTGLFRYNGLSDFNSITTNEYYQLNPKSKIIGEGKSTNYISLSRASIATQEQIEEILFLVAKEKGYVEGAKVIPFNAGSISDYKGYTVIESNYDYDHDGLWMHSYAWNSVIYRDGKWAEFYNGIELPFGNLTFTITKEYAECKHGKIWLKEVKELIEWFDKPIQILGYDMGIKNEGKWYIKFGCCEGTYLELKAIYTAMSK